MEENFYTVGIILLLLIFVLIFIWYCFELKRLNDEIKVSECKVKYWKKRYKNIGVKDEDK